MGELDISVPFTYKEAMESSDRTVWEEAMQEEMDSMERMETWELQPLPKGGKAIQSKWVYSTKTDVDQNVTRHRARLVAKGFTQREGIDYDEVFAPVAKYSTLHFLLALATEEALSMLQLDVKASFLNGTLEEELYLSRPEGFIVKGTEHLVYRLFKALYGLKQASRAWHAAIDLLLNELGFYNSTTDTSLYVMVRDGNRIFILVYVDDILLVGREIAWLKDISILIGNKFEVRTEECFNKILGIIVEAGKDSGKSRYTILPWFTIF